MGKGTTDGRMRVEEMGRARNMTTVEAAGGTRDTEDMLAVVEAGIVEVVGMEAVVVMEVLKVVDMAAVDMAAGELEGTLNNQDTIKDTTLLHPRLKGISSPTRRRLEKDMLHRITTTAVLQLHHTGAMGKHLKVNMPPRAITTDTIVGKINSCGDNVMG